MSNVFLKSIDGPGFARPVQIFKTYDVPSPYPFGFWFSCGQYIGTQTYYNQHECELAAEARAKQPDGDQINRLDDRQINRYPQL